MVRPRSEKRPPEIAAILPEAQTFLSPGKEYEVYAITVFKGMVHLQTIDDLRMINWYPAWFFEVCDRSLPEDWICSLLADQPTMLIGPSFVAQDEPSYARMVERHPEQVDLFWKRFDRLHPPPDE